MSDISGHDRKQPNLLFVLVDGWHLICESMVTSFVTG